MTRTACLVCFISTVNDRNKKKKRRLFMSGASSGHITKLKQSIILRCLCFFFRIFILFTFSELPSLVSRSFGAILDKISKHLLHWKIWHKRWHHDTQLIDIQLNDTRNINEIHDAQHNDTKCWKLLYWLSRFYIVILSAGSTNSRWRLSTVKLLIKKACFVKEWKQTINIKTGYLD
jgi:hypothetical protein